MSGRLVLHVFGRACVSPREMGGETNKHSSIGERDVFCRWQRPELVDMGLPCQAFGNSVRIGMLSSTAWGCKHHSTGAAGVQMMVQFMARLASCAGRPQGVWSEIFSDKGQARWHIRVSRAIVPTPKRAMTLLGLTFKVGWLKKRRKHGLALCRYPSESAAGGGGGGRPCIVCGPPWSQLPW